MQWRKDSFSTNGVGKTRHSYAKKKKKEKKNLDLIPTPHEP